MIADNSDICSTELAPSGFLLCLIPSRQFVYQQDQIYIYIYVRTEINLQALAVGENHYQIKLGTIIYEQTLKVYNIYIYRII